MKNPTRADRIVSPDGGPGSGQATRTKAGRWFGVCTVERIEPERYFSFRWIPYGIDAEADPAREPTTLVEFFLKEVPEGTLLTIVESGFDRVPPHRRERAFRMNESGWAAQSENIKRYVERS